MSGSDGSVGWNLALDFHAQGSEELEKEGLQKFVGRVFPQFAKALDEVFDEADPDRKGRVSRKDFVVFAERHYGELNLKPMLLMHKLAMQGGRNARGSKKKS